MNEAKTDFVIRPLAKERFADHFSYSKDELAKVDAKIIEVANKPGFPCRVSLCDLEVGEKVLSTTFVHLNEESPYKSAGPIFVRKGAESIKLGVNEIPKLLFHRHLSIRGYDKQHMMKQCSVLKGDAIGEELNKMFANGKVNYIHIHNAGPGCYLCSVHRV